MDFSSPKYPSIKASDKTYYGIFRGCAQFMAHICKEFTLGTTCSSAVILGLQHIFFCQLAVSDISYYSMNNIIVASRTVAFTSTSIVTPVAVMYFVSPWAKPSS